MIGMQGGHGLPGHSPKTRRFGMDGKYTQLKSVKDSAFWTKLPISQMEAKKRFPVFLRIILKNKNIMV
jgi:hypothetical protein